MFIVHTGRTKRQLKKYLSSYGPLDLVATQGSVTRRVRAYLDQLGNLFIVDLDTTQLYPSFSAHRGAVFSPAGSNTYDTYYQASTGLTLRKVLQLGLGAPR